MIAELPDNEILRLKALHDLAILDTPREQSFDDIAQIAMHLCDVPIAVVSLIDRDRQWFKSCIGLDAAETPRDIAFCAHAILMPSDILVVEDATKDKRFADNELVVNSPYIRFYAGVPLVNEEGFALGTLCVVDYRPRVLSNAQLVSLRALARQVMHLLELKSINKSMQEYSSRIKGSESLLRSLLSNFPGAAYRCENNSSWTMHYLSDAVEQLTGYSAKNFIRDSTLNFNDITHPNDVSRVHSSVQEALAKHQSFDIEYRIKRADGQWRHVQEIGRGVFDTQGNLQFIDGFIWDIQSRIDSVSEKRIMTNKLSQLFEMAPIGIIQVKESGQVLDANPEFIKMIGYSKAELSALSILDFIPKNEWDHIKTAMDVRDSERFGPMEKTYRHKNGELIPVEISGSLINTLENDEQCWWTLVKDIREQKRVERMKSEFISTVSHELRTPLTSISGALSLIINNMLGAIPDKAQAMLEIAYKNSQRLSLLINDLLDMEKLIAGKMDFDLNIKAVYLLVQQALLENKMYADKYAVKYVLRDISASAAINIDAFRFQQIMSNFLSNAAKFSPPQSLVDITISANEGWVRISVRDYGSGIPEEFKSRMFQKFSQADSSDSRQKSGTGLGLAISKELAERMGGKIGFESESGKGSCFYTEFRQAQ
ncbi:MAG: PAS domain S-box protein [Gammaproteobacteria bacterium]|nr:MAG: PAS domain S-box protein [Gammaproteobacteria bacterium]